MDNRQAEYIQLLQERNRLKRQMKAKSKQEQELEARERGFSAHFSGANNMRNATADDTKKPVAMMSGKPITLPNTDNTQYPTSSSSDKVDQTSSPRALVDKDQIRSSSASSAPRIRGWASKPPEQLFGIPISSSSSPKSDNVSELSTPTSVFQDMMSSAPSIVQNNIFKSQLDNILRKSIPNNTFTLSSSISKPTVPKPHQVDLQHHVSDDHDDNMGLSQRRHISPKLIVSPKEMIPYDDNIVSEDNDELEYSDHDDVVDDLPDEDEESAYIEDFENVSDEEWSDSVKVWKAQTQIKAETWKSIQPPPPSSSSKHYDGSQHHVKKIMSSDNVSIASSIDSNNSVSSSRRLSSIIDKTYQSSPLGRKTLRHPKPKPLSSSHRARQDDIQLLTDMMSGKNIDMDSSLIRKLMALDPQQKAIILSALQPNADANSHKANDDDKEAEDDVVYEDEVALNIRIKILSTWTKSKAGSLSCIILRSCAPSTSPSSSNDTKPPPVINYLMQLPGRVLSGIEYLPPSSEAMRMLPQIILSTNPKQKMFPSDPKHVWKAPLSTDHPIEVAFHGNISIRGDQSTVPITEDTTADDILDGLELILVNGYGMYSCKDVDVYIGYRCVWSGELPDTSMFTNDRSLSVEKRLPILMNDAIKQDQLWSKHIIGLGRKNFIQRKKSLSVSEGLKINHLDDDHVLGDDTNKDIDEMISTIKQQSAELRADPIDEVTEPSLPIWLDAPAHTFNAAGKDHHPPHHHSSTSSAATGTKKPPIWLSNTGKHRDNTTYDNISPTAPIEASPVKTHPRHRHHQQSSSSSSGNKKSTISSPDQSSSIINNNSPMIPAKGRSSRAADKNREEERLRQSLEALTISDRSNLGRLQVSSSASTSLNASIEMNITAASRVSPPPNESASTITTGTVSAMPTNILRRRAKRIQEVNKTVQTTVQNLAHVFNTNIILHPSHQQASTIISSSDMNMPSSSNDQVSIEAVGSISSLDQPSASDSHSNSLNSSSILSTILPKGRILTIDIFSTWGDEFYMGLNGFDLFDASGHVINASSGQILSIIANPSDINILPDYHHDPRVVTNLIDGMNFTKNDLHMWLAPIGYYKPPANITNSSSSTTSCRYIDRQPIASITITFHSIIALSMIRVFNYNKSRTHIQRGVRDCRMLFDGVSIYDGEIRIATGDLLSADACSEVILFTLDDQILRPIAENDEAAGYYTKDLSQDWLKKLRKKLHHTRPSTADQKQSNESNDSSLSSIHHQPTIQPSNLPQPVTSSISKETTSSHQHGPSMPSIKESTPSKDIRADDDSHEVNIDDVINDISNVLSPPNQPSSSSTTKPTSSKLIKSATFTNGSKASSSTSSLAKAIDIKSLSLPPSIAINYTSLSYPIINCRRITINLISTWGDPHYLGLAGIEIMTISNNKLHPISLSMNHIEHIEPRDLSSIGIYDDPRVSDNLFNGINNLTDDRFMWMIPYTSDGHHFIQFDLQQRYPIVGLRVWNYNRYDESILRGVKELSIECDGQLLGHWMCHLATGYDGINSSQMIYFHELITPPILATTAQRTSSKPSSSSSNSRFVRYITPALKQDYEPQILPSGMLFTFTLLDNHGDDYFIGLDRIEFIDHQGRTIDFHSCEASIHASPYSLHDLDSHDNGSSYANDDRIPANLISTYTNDDHNRSWLAPISHSMTAYERKASIMRNIPSTSTHHNMNNKLKNIYANYHETLSNHDDIDEETITIPRENKIWIIFRYPVSISAIRIYNYTKTPSRGVKEFSLHLDSNLIYIGSLHPTTEHKPQSIVFNNDPKIVRNEKDHISFCGIIEQDVLYINERQVMVRSKDMYTRKPSVASEGVYVDIKNRPTTSAQHH